MADDTYLELLFFTHLESYHLPPSPATKRATAIHWQLLGRLRISCRSAATATAALLVEHLRDAGSSARYGAEFEVSFQQHQPSLDSGDVELGGVIMPPAR